MRLQSIALMLLSLAACASSENRGTAPATGAAPASKPQGTETEVVTRVSFTEEGPCDAPGFPELAGQTRVRLTFVEWPHFHEDFCSSDLAAHLRKASAKEVPVTISFDPQGRGHAICGIDGIVGKRLERGGCSFQGVLSGGTTGYGYESKGGEQLSDADLPPWELRARKQ